VLEGELTLAIGAATITVTAGQAITISGMRVSSLRVCLAVPVMSRMIGSTLARKPQCAGLVP
jgi:hypothetical protein